MPKKVHGRPAAKAKTRSRRTPARPIAPGESGVAVQDELLPGTAVQSVAPVGQTFAGGRASSTTAIAGRRPVRRAPILTFNYSYLRGDIRSLSVLAPSMIVLLVIAFFVFR